MYSLLPLPPAVRYFLAALGFFHSSEFILAALFMRDELSPRSLLFSAQYCAAMAFAVMEFVAEHILLGPWKEQPAIVHLGLAAVAIGEVMRKTAMLTARSNFTHDIRGHKRQGHRLVTSGIYRHIRHPGYLGWYIWALGTQILLCNPISCLAFAITIWKFFKDRIEYEEYTLVDFFGEDYLQYASRTPTWIPFIP